MANACEETVEERQENELQLLEAVYNDDVVDLRHRDAWKVVFVTDEGVTGLRFNMGDNTIYLP